MRNMHINFDLGKIYKAEKLSVYLSVHKHFWHADNSDVAEMRPAQNESCVFGDQGFIEVYRTNCSCTRVRKRHSFKLKEHQC